MQLFVLAGWRLVLGLRLGPRPSPDHVLGWRITAREADTVRLRLDFTLMTGRLAVRVQPSTVEFATSVTYQRPAARMLRSAVGVVHRIVVLRLLRRAALAHRREARTR